MMLRFAVALAIGILIGAERHWRERDAPPGSRAAGIRTYTASALLGALAVALGQTMAGGADRAPGLAGAIVIAAVFLAFAGAFTLFKHEEAERHDDVSVTGVIAAFATFALGALAMAGERTGAVAGAVALTILLSAREQLHGLVARLQWNDFRAALVILAMTFLVLPLLPRITLGPFGGIAPREVWLFAILMASVSFAGYIAVRALGAARGLALAGAVGGLASSTAVTLDFARRAKAAPARAALYAGGAMAAAAISILRTGLIACAIAPVLAPLLAPGLLGAAAIYGFGAAITFHRHPRESEAGLSLGNPFDLAAIAQFVTLLVGVTFAVKAALALLGPAAAQAIAALTGLVDVDAITVAAPRAIGAQMTAAAAAGSLMAALAANATAKSFYGLIFGIRPFAARFAGVSLAAGSLAALLTWAAR